MDPPGRGGTASKWQEKGRSQSGRKALLRKREGGSGRGLKGGTELALGGRGFKEGESLAGAERRIRA